MQSFWHKFCCVLLFFNGILLLFNADCRICVWNAVDGSLVHSLTGHTESVSGLTFPFTWMHF